MRPLLPLSSTLLVSLFCSVSFSQSQSQLKIACSLSGYPDCVCTSCVVPMLPNYCPNILDISCPCVDTQYMSDVTACVLANCTVAEGQRAWNIGSSICLSYGVTLPTKPPIPSSSQSNSRNTASPNSNAASATADTSGAKSTDGAGNNSGGLPTGTIVGIAIGVVGGIAVGALIAYLVLRRRQHSQAPLPPPPPPLQQQVVQPPLGDKPYTSVAYLPPPPGQQLHSEPAPYIPQTHGQQQVVLPISELQSPNQSQGPPLPAPTPQRHDYAAVPPPLYEMPNR